MMEEDVTAVKEINGAEPEPTVFNDEEVTLTIAQTLIKINAKKQRILDEQMAKRLQDEEIKQAAAREKQKKEDLERAKVLQQAAKETLLQESFKKLRVEVEDSGSSSTQQDTPTVNPTEISKEDV
nr:hypothetical protein [Tanacetum cinerariifolium]